MKTTGKIQKNAKKKSPHPNSRKALKLAGAKIREERLQLKEDRKAEQIAAKISMFKWYQDEMRERLVDLKDFTKADAQDFFRKYLHRFDEELNQISETNQILKRKTTGSRLANINALVLKERQLIDSSGLEGPNLFNFKSLEEWLEWDGEFDSMPRLKTKKWTTQALDINSSVEL
ncbi:Oidioi.mRNA.OKI2018_I69.XSR.g15028.t1.cds [Oikopleura dioica]|uniref:Translation machinery-associated protein 16 n=1 Tax=Oikopleura dioica TaxID=34765 RepID=A0ABN7SFM8_OIKDI|nr:Oidioi.mRNA.OKI2018_I69.XSR.g15028.t1.cds [Oikopleura dioica]